MYYTGSIAPTMNCELLWTLAAVDGITPVVLSSSHRTRINVFTGGAVEEADLRLNLFLKQVFVAHSQRPRMHLYQIKHTIL